jgi:hypothetical protein
MKLSIRVSGGVVAGDAPPERARELLPLLSLAQVGDYPDHLPSRGGHRVAPFAERRA